MRRGIALLGFVVAVVTASVAAMFVGHGPSTASASSHSEAPLISQDPRADNTDLYAFVSPDDTSKVTFVANYIPLEAPASGPNFPSFDDTVLYEIKIDNTGDGKDDLGYQFSFSTKTRNPNTFLYNTGPISSLSDANWNRPQTYTVTLVHFKKDGKIEQGGKDRPVVLVDNAPTPPDNIGPRSTPNYDALAAAAVTSLPGGGKVFAGQRDDPFFVDLGSIFDLAGLRPFNPFHLLPLGATAGVDALKNYNTHSIVLQVPISQVATAANSSIGVYASASRHERTILKKDGTTDAAGEFVQVSRLGNPLVNEVLIPLGHKDQWNRSEPEDDSQFEPFYATPEVAHLENVLYGGTLPLGHAGGALQPIAESGRGDLDAILLTGVTGLNFTGPTQSDLLRINTAIKPGVNGACPGGVASAAAPDRMAVLAADLCGFPNGRRLGDDVVDIELRAIAQGYGTFLNGAFGLPNLSPNNLVGDGVDAQRHRVRGHVPVRRFPASGLPGALSGPNDRAGGQPAGRPPASGQRSNSVRRMRWTVGASVAAATVVVLLLGGVFRDSSAATPSPIVEPAAATGQFQAGFSAGGSSTAAAVSKLQAKLRAEPERRAVTRRTRPRLPAAGSGDRRSELLHALAGGPRPGPPPRPARSRRDERARLAGSLPPSLRGCARARPQGARDLADDCAQLRRHRRCPRRARPVSRGVRRLRHDGDAPSRPLLLRARLARSRASRPGARGDRDDAARRRGSLRPGRARSVDAVPARQALLVDRPGRRRRATGPRRAQSLSRLPLCARRALAHRSGEGTSSRRRSRSSSRPSTGSRCRNTWPNSATSTASTGRRRARKQYALIRVIERLLVANGVKTDLETALFDVDHGIRLPAALALARRPVPSGPRSTAMTSSRGPSTGTVAAAKRSATRSRRSASAPATRSSSSIAG